LGGVISSRNRGASGWSGRTAADITAIAELVNGKQHGLFFDMKTLATRGLSFMKETKEWFDRWNARQ